VRFCGFVVPDKSPENPVKVQLLPAGVAFTETTLPLRYQPLLGAIEPPFEGLAEVVK
jgi:hypothetical protein